MRKVLSAVIVISAVSLLAVFLLSKISPVESIENALYDYRLQYFAPKTDVSKDIVMIWIDEETIAGLPYRSPVPRDFLADINSVLVNAGARIIAYDIFFEDLTVPAADNRLAGEFAEGSVYSVSAGELSPDGTLVEDRPHEIFRRALKGFALSDLPLNAYDATVRDFQPFRIIGGERRPTFAAELFTAATGKSAAQTLEDGVLHLAGLEFRPYKRLADGELISPIHFAGAPGVVGGGNNPFPVYSAGQVAKGLIPPGWFKDKIVLIGSAYEYSPDLFLTPYFGKRYDYRRMNGVEIHANILNSLLTGEFYYLSSLPQTLILCFMISFVVSLCSLRMRLAWSLAPIAAILLLYLFLTLFVFTGYALLFPFVMPVSGLAASFGLTVLWRAVTEGRQKRFIKKVFSHYVPQTVVDQMIAEPSRLVLGGECRMITSMFTDIESFTTISEKLEPQILTSILNDYFDRAGEAIFKYGGTLDKYEGDAMIAFFGAPLDLPAHEKAAVTAALEIQKISRDVSEKWMNVCGREIVTRIGINTGPAVVGNMGSSERFDYTAIGDTVNLASRLEQTNKEYGTRILISEFTKKGLGDGIKCRAVACVRVKGRAEAVQIYEPIV